MNLKFILTFLTVILMISVEGKRSGGGRSSRSSRGSSRNTSYRQKSAQTSFNPQSAAPKSSLFSWLERLFQKNEPSTNNQRHSYPSSGTGLSGNSVKQPSTYQGNIHASMVSNNKAGHTNSQQSHSYPQSTGLSGSGNSYAQQTASKYLQQQYTGTSGNIGGSQYSYPQSSGPGLSGRGQPGSDYLQHHGSSLTRNSNPQQPGLGLSGQPWSGFSHSGSAHNGYPQAPPPYSGYRTGETNHQSNRNQTFSNNPHFSQTPPPPDTIRSYYGGYNAVYGSHVPGYFGDYVKKRDVSRAGSALSGVGTAGASIGTVLTGLALWNLVRSTGHKDHAIVYDVRKQPVAVVPANNTAPDVNSILANLFNCSLTISNDNKTEVLAIPCAIATSFTSKANVKDLGIRKNEKDNTKCTISVVTNARRRIKNTIPCSILLNTAAEKAFTEAPILENEQENIFNITNIVDSFKDGDKTNKTDNGLTALKIAVADTNVDTYLNCTLHLGQIRDPINPCY